MRSLPSDQNTIDTTAYEGEIQLVFSQVYLLMTLGLVITAVVAAWVSASPTMLRLIYTNLWVPLALFVVQIILVIALTAAISRLSTGVAVALFVAYAALLAVLDSHLCGHCDLRRPDRLRHAEDQADGGQWISRRPQSQRHRRDGRAGLVSRLHQPVPVAPAHFRAQPLKKKTRWAKIIQRVC